MPDAPRGAGWPRHALLAPAPLWFAPRPLGGPVGRWLLVMMLCAQGFMRIPRMPSDTWAFAPESAGA